MDPQGRRGCGPCSDGAQSAPGFPAWGRQCPWGGWMGSRRALPHAPESGHRARQALCCLRGWGAMA
eukprot:3472496-Alexandrium_andersonii.AAC.1